MGMMVPLIIKLREGKSLARGARPQLGIVVALDCQFAVG